MKKYLFIFVLLLLSVIQSNAQCSMCTANAENSVRNGNTQGLGLNTGVLYLLSFPFILIGGVGSLWYFKFRETTQEEDNKK